MSLPFKLHLDRFSRFAGLTGVPSRLTDRQTDKHTRRQTDIQTDTQRDTQTTKRAKSVATDRIYAMQVQDKPVCYNLAYGYLISISLCI